jgi:DNA polymerase-3 subunit alpha
VHKLYVKAKQDASKVKYDHPVIQDVLGPTFGYVVFQEQFMMLAEKLAGFTPGEADQLRKTLVKKSLDTLGKKSSEKEAAMQQFVEGAKITVPLWETIEAFSVYGFNKSHSVSYAIDSYYAAWLHTHFETDWLATILESATGNPDELAKTISEIKEIGYKFSPADINYSGLQWEYSEQAGAFVPPLTSLKGVGDTAVEEVMANRPYLCLDDLLFDDQGEWKHSKLNKTGLVSLTKTSSLTSLREFRNGDLTHHKAVHDLILENYDVLRKGRMGMTEAAIKRANKKGEPVVPILSKLVPEYAQREDWSRIDKVRHAIELTSMYDLDLIIPPHLRRKFEAASVPTLSRLAERTAPSDETEYLSWFCVLAVNKKTTKKGKPYLQITGLDTDGKHNVKVWSPRQDEEIDLYSIWLSTVKNNGDWGFSTSGGKMKRITVADGGAL